MHSIDLGQHDRSILPWCTLGSALAIAGGVITSQSRVLLLSIDHVSALYLLQLTV